MPLNADAMSVSVFEKLISSKAQLSCCFVCQDKYCASPESWKGKDIKKR